MSEVNSIQMAKLAATPPSRLDANERFGRVRISFGQIAANAAAVGDTIFFCQIPAGCRIVDVKLSNAVGTANSTLALGLRKSSDKTVIDADGLMVATSIATAQNASEPTGALLAAGATYVTDDQVDVYGTIAGAATPNPQEIAVTVFYVAD